MLQQLSSMNLNYLADREHEQNEGDVVRGVARETGLHGMSVQAHTSKQ